MGEGTPGGGATVIQTATGGSDRGMGELPAGSVTLLFSDIEGSTALLGRLGEAYGEALSAQRAIVRAAAAGSGGRELGTEGDSFFVVFSSAGDAVGCAVAAQRALACYDWPGGVAVRVRMGLHSGEPARHEEGYIGLDVHRAARIAAAAHGGQVVLSEATRLLAGPGLPSGVSVRDLGFHRLKDIEAPEHLYQLVVAGLAEEFPPLKSLGAQTSLPAPATPLVGREPDLDQVREVITQPGVRLVTLTGTGGVGKTRLALAAAALLDREFVHGVFFVALAAVRDGEVMWKAIAEDLDVGGDRPPADAVAGYLAGRRALLVLDNLEQLDGAAGVVAGLLEAAPRLVVLATSRRPLHLHGERELPVAPLGVPAGAAGAGDVSASAAVRLFTQQAGMVKPGFAVTEANAADIAAICRRLDGLPLAIELTAPWVKLLTPRALLARLEHSLGPAAGDAVRPSRQQTMYNTIAWSYDLLTPGLAAVFLRAGVFAGGCDLDALAAVAVTGGGQETGGDVLELATELLDVSLITVTEGPDGEPRVYMLETIRQYALEHLAEAGDLDDTRRRHARYYAEFAERVGGQLRGPNHLASLDILEAEHDNLRAALAWSLDPAAGAPSGGERAATGLRLVQALGPFWYRHGHAAEGRRWLERAIALAPDEAGAPLAKVTHWLGVLLQQQGDFDAAVRLLQRSLAIWRNLGEQEEQARELNSLGITYFHSGRLDGARSFLEGSASIARETGSDAQLASALTNLGHVEIDAGNLERAMQVLQESLTLKRRRGDMFGVANAQQALAVASLRGGRPGEARDMLSRTFDYVVSSGDAQFLANTLELSACVVAELGDGLAAARLAGSAETVRQRAGLQLPEPDAALIERYLAPARAVIAREVWDAELAAGRALTQQQAVTLLLASAP